MSYRYLFSPLNDISSIQGELPVKFATITEELNEAGTASLTLPLNPTKAGKFATITPAVLGSGKTAIIAERDGVPFWGGILWAKIPSLSSDTIVLNCAGFHSYVRRRLIRATQTFSSTDQHDIARSLIDYSEAQSGGSIGILTTDTNTSGVTRDRTYNGFERHWVGQAIDQLAALNDGFDFRYDVVRAAEGDPITIEFRASYPTTGRQTEHVFELGTNITDLEAPEDATLLANQADAIGAGEGENMLIQTHTDTGALAEYPLLEAVVAHTDVSVDATLKSYANRRVNQGIAPIVRPTFRVLPDTLPKVGSYEVGDQVKIKATRGLLDLDGTYRIVSITINVTEAGQESATLACEPLGVFVS